MTGRKVNSQCNLVPIRRSSSGCQSVARVNLQRAGMRNCSLRQGDMYQLRASNGAFVGAALARAAHSDDAPAEDRSRDLEALEDHRRQLARWAEHCPENFQDRHALVSAEQARVEERVLDAQRLYDQAIRSARENGFIQDEALAHELRVTIAGVSSASSRPCFSPRCDATAMVDLWPHQRQVVDEVATAWPEGRLGADLS